MEDGDHRPRQDENQEIDHPRKPRMFARILNANGSQTGFRSFAIAISLVKQNGAGLYMVCVEEIP